jgi:hypothetical protein
MYTFLSGRGKGYTLLGRGYRVLKGDGVHSFRPTGLR